MVATLLVLVPGIDGGGVIMIRCSSSSVISGIVPSGCAMTVVNLFLSLVMVWIVTGDWTVASVRNISPELSGFCFC